jgi:hypothetical protein
MSAKKSNDPTEQERLQMEENLAEFERWISALKDYHMADWNSLPEIDLYMDQVVNYMDRQLTPLKTDEEEKLLTPAMINNYVKFNTLPKPEGKKYSKRHLGRLFPLTILKQCLPLPVIGRAIGDFRSMLTGQTAYERYCKLQTEAFNHIASRALEIEGETAEEKINRLEIFAFEIATEAVALRLVAERILKMVMVEEKEKEEAKKVKKETEKEKLKELKS